MAGMSIIWFTKLRNNLAYHKRCRSFPDGHSRLFLLKYRLNPVRRGTCFGGGGCRRRTASRISLEEGITDYSRGSVFYQRQELILEFTIEASVKLLIMLNGTVFKVGWLKIWSFQWLPPFMRSAMAMLVKKITETVFVTDIRVNTVSAIMLPVKAKTVRLVANNNGWITVINYSYK